MARLAAERNFRRAKGDTESDDVENEETIMPGNLFDPSLPLLIHEHCRPHWSQAGAIVFITFRTGDSIPREVLERWEREKQEWLYRRGYESHQHWKITLPSLNARDRTDFTKEFERCREDFLDTCHGQCVLGRRDLAEIVASSLLHFDGTRYRMGDFIVMPNHVHLLAAFPSAEAMVSQCASWMHFTAVQINRSLKQKGKFWQQEPFDHLVRSVEQYEYLRRYIADNGRKANLPPESYLYRRYNA